MYTIATLYQFKRHLGIPPANTNDDDRLLTVMRAATRHMEQQTLRHLQPYRASIAHDIDPLFPADLLLTDDLLQLIRVEDGDGTINPDDITMLPPEQPASLLRLNGVYAWDGSPRDAVTVTGIWGWHNAPLEMWQSTGDAVNDMVLSATATTLTVSDADAPYADGQTPRFAVGALLQIEDEFLRVLAVDPTTNTLTVTRGAGNTIPAAHAQGTPIAVYRPPYHVLMTALRLGAYFYRQADAQKPDPLPLDVFRTLTGLRRIAVRA